jgi:hypothetical protein
MNQKKEACMEERVLPCNLLTIHFIVDHQARVLCVDPVPSLKKTNNKGMPTAR